MAQSQIRQPSQEEILRTLMAGNSSFDPTLASRGVIEGQNLADTVLKNKQGQEDRITVLKEKIRQATLQRNLASTISKENPTAGLAASVDPAQAAKQKLEQYFTERAAKTPKTPTYSKVGETADEIILADLTDPAKQFRVKAPGVGGQAKTRPGVNKLAANIINSIQQGGITSGFIDDLKTRVGEFPQSAGAAALLKGQELARGFAGGNTDVIAYEKSRPTIGRSLYKFLSGDVGNISESEGKFATDLLPSVYEAPALQASKIARLENLKTRANQVVSDVAKLSLQQNWTEEETEKKVKEAVLKVMQEAALVPGNPAPAQPTGNPGGSGLSPEQRRARIAELQATIAQGQ